MTDILRSLAIAVVLATVSTIASAQNLQPILHHREADFRFPQTPAQKVVEGQQVSRVSCKNKEMARNFAAFQKAFDAGISGAELDAKLHGGKFVSVVDRMPRYQVRKVPDGSVNGAYCIENANVPDNMAKSQVP